MKKTMIMLFVLCAAACTKEMRVPSAQNYEMEGQKEICFDVNYQASFITTKITEINRDNLGSFDIVASTGAAGSETQQWSATATRQTPSGPYVTGKYWPYTDPSYHFYASNSAMTFAAEGTTVTVDGSGDVVCACLYTPTYNTTNPVVFSHIMARIGTIEVSSSKGYDVTVGSLTLLQPKTSGTYNMRTSEWSNKNVAANKSLVLGNNDYLLLPDTYLLQVRYTLTKGDYTASFVNSGEVALNAGKVSNIVVTLSADPAVAINFSVSVEDWNASAISLTLE